MPAYTILTTAAAYPSEINKKDVRNLDFNAAPKVTDHREVDIYWNDEEHWGRNVTAAKAEADVTETTLQFTSATDVGSVVVNQLIRNCRTNEQMLVTGHSSTDKLVVVRGAGQTAAAAINKDDVFQILGTSIFDRSVASEMRAPVMTEKFHNYMQTLDVSYEITEGAKVFEFQGGPLLLRVTREAAIEACFNLEDTLLRGEKGYYQDPTRANNLKHFTCGLIPFLKQEGKIELDLNGSALTLQTMLAFEAEYKADDTGRAVWLCSKNALGAIDNILLNNLRVTSSEAIKLAVGLRVMRFHSTLRDIDIYHCPALDVAGNDVDIIRYNPAKYMELLTVNGGWLYKQCDKDRPQTWESYWLHGTFGAKYHLAKDVGGIVKNVASPFTALTAGTGNDRTLSA
jgi:hypothetical protein